MQLQPWPASTSARGEQEWDLPQQPSEPQSVSPSNSTLRLHPPLALLLFLSTAGHRPRACAPRRRHMRVCLRVCLRVVCARLRALPATVDRLDPGGRPPRQHRCRGLLGHAQHRVHDASRTGRGQVLLLRLIWLSRLLSRFRFHFSCSWCHSLYGACTACGF